jgi:hypothetical protein
MHWRGVPSEKQAEWSQVFVASTEGVVLTAPCPCCGARSLRRFYSSSINLLPLVCAGFKGRGSSWEWCVSCGAFEHASCLVPSWWEPVPGVNERVLTALPQEIQEQLSALGVA